MTLFFIVLTVLVVVAIGLVSVGRATARLVAAPPRQLFSVDEAVEFISERLPDEVTAQLSYDDVRHLVEWHVDYLAAKGMAAERDPFTAVDAPVVTDEDEGLAYVLGKAGEAGLEVDDTWVVAVIDAEAAYLEAIGAIGGPVAPPEG